MRKTYAFYAGMIYGEYEMAWPATIDFPDGLYLRSAWNDPNEVIWYIKQFGSMTAINCCDIPKNLLALCLILGVDP